MKQNDKKHLTAENGRPIADNQNTQTAGVRGPVTLQDPWLMEKLAHFDREVIPERRMHAKGSGAYGTFTVTHDISAYTRASIFSEVGKKTECFVRFSTVAGERGAADAERDIRGFAMKFYTDTGNWDLVGNNTPVFFLRDPLKFPDLNHAIKRDPRTGMRSANSNWDFWTLLPEALHQVTITMSPRGIPASFRHMHGFGSHTYSFIDANNRRTWVKFHLRTLQGIKNMTDAEAEAVIAKDRESHQRDLFEAIERGDYPRWLMQVQLMSEEQAKEYHINPFDLTKVWYHGDFPLHDVGILERGFGCDCWWFNWRCSNYWFALKFVVFVWWSSSCWWWNRGWCIDYYSNCGDGISGVAWIANNVCERSFCEVFRARYVGETERAISKRN